MASSTPPAGSLGAAPPAAAGVPALTVDERPPDAGATPQAPRPVSADRLAAGDLIDDRYEVIAELGRGGMGRVLACRDRKLGRDVALKIIRVAAEEDGLLRFGLEARSAAALHHPNVVAVFDTGVHAQLPYISTEILHGQTLRQRLDKGRLGAREAAGIAVQIAKGLSAVHAQGVVHRDLKPENVFLCDDGWTKLLDFGIVKLLSRDAGADEGPRASSAAGAADRPRPNTTTTSTPTPSTEAGRILGTAGYMSPEQVRGHPIEQRADLFALGAVFYEMLTGIRAFKGSTQVETMYAVLHGEPAPLPAGLPQRLRDLIQRCLAKLPEGRPASADEVVQLLEPIAAHLPLGPISLEPPSRLRRNLRFVAAALAALAVVLAVAVLSRRHRPPAPPAQRIIAVLPFTVRGPASDAYLGDGMVDLLSMSLSGRSLRTVDPHALLGSLASVQRPIDLGRGQEIAKQLGATEFILGTVVESNGELRAQAALYSTDDLRAPKFEARSTGATKAVFQIVDELTSQLRGLPVLEFERGGPGENQFKLAQLTTSNPDALAAYLRGEALSRHGQDLGASEAFRQALALDPGFALADYRLAVVTTSFEPELSRQSLVHSLRPGTRLPERYQLLARAFLAYEDGRFDEAERGFRDYLRSHPEDIWAWLNLGEVLFHLGPIHGRAAQESVQAFEHTLLLDPSQQGDPLGHLLDLAQLRNNRELILTLSSRYLAQAVEAESITRPIRWIRAWADGDKDGQQQIVDQLASPGAASVDLRMTCLRALYVQDFAGCRSVALAGLASGDPAKQVDGRRALGLVELMRGRPQAGLAQLRLVPPAELRVALDRLWIATLDFFPLPPSELAAALSEARALPATADPLLIAKGRYLTGLLLARLNQFEDAEAKARQLEEMQPVAGSVSRDLGLGLRAQVQAERGQPDAALATLDQQELRVPLTQSFQFPRIAESRLRAALEARRGNLDRALALADVVTFYNVLEPIYLVPSALDRARLFEKRGDRERAIEEYEHVTTAWADCEPALRPTLDDAAQHLAALRAQVSANSNR